MSLLLVLIIPFIGYAQQPEAFQTYKAKVVDGNTKNALAFAGIHIEGTNYTTVSNKEGEFSIKYSEDATNAVVIIHYIGYKSKRIKLIDITADTKTIELDPAAVELPEVSVISKDAETLVTGMFDNRGKNYANTEEHLTAFYRETIRKNKTYASLSEAVIDISKQPYSSYKSDIVSIYKSRKKTDYTKVDTLIFKLMGGPFNNLYLDLIKYPEMIFTDKMLDNYDFTFDRSTRVGNRLIYIVDFNQKKHIQEPLYSGKLYIDAQSLALKSAVFKLNLNFKNVASMFIVKKPTNADVTPIEASYRVDFIENDNKWYFGYSRIELGLRINWKKKLFNSNFHSTIELAITDKDKLMSSNTIARDQRIKPSVVITDEASGFADTEFWGKLNVIEPEKPIETAIRKIQKQLEKK
ncbi:MAG: carboxypeptidase-like regulatory domain-containing protein [Paludibacter sp.]|nr:carboxypeptidase-like regulatory domain-containing protein [Paludibacter sp.]